MSSVFVRERVCVRERENLSAIAGSSGCQV